MIWIRGGIIREHPFRGAVPYVLAGEPISHSPAGGLRRAGTRDILAYLLHTSLGFSQRETAKVLGVNGTTVLRGVRLIEDRRDEPGIDAALDILDRRLRNHTHSP